MLLPLVASLALSTTLDDLKLQVKPFEYYVGYTIARGLEEPENWILRIEWDSLEGHEQGFRKSADFREFFVLVRPFFDAIEEMKHYEASAVSRAAR